LICGQWSRENDTPIITSISHIEFTNNLKDALSVASDLDAILAVAFQQLEEKHNFTDEQITVALEDSLVYHDIFTVEESLTKHEVWDYVKWEAHQKWGKFGFNLKTFGAVFRENPFQYHTVTCSSNLLETLKRSISNLNGKFNWLGTYSAVFYGIINPDKTTAFIFDEGTFYQIYLWDNHEFSYGKVRFLSTGPSITNIVGNPDKFRDTINNTESDTYYNMVDSVSKIKAAHWKDRKYSQLIPFDGINVEGIDVSEDVHSRELNVLTALIMQQPDVKTIDLSKPAGIYEFSMKKQVRPDVKLKKTTRIKKSKKKGKFRRFAFWLLFLGLVGYTLFYSYNNESIKQYFLQLYYSISPQRQESNKIEESIRQLHSTSENIFRAFDQINDQIDFSILLRLTIADNDLLLETADSSDIQINLSELGRNILRESQEIDCCGGVKQIITLQLIPSGIVGEAGIVTPQAFKNILSKEFSAVVFQELDIIKTENLEQHPIIIQTTSRKEINDLIELFHIVDGSFILRKIDIVQNPDLDEFEARFYVLLVDYSVK